MNTDIIGWDIGGAHLKIAHIDANGQIKSVQQLKCPLWQGLDRLKEAIEVAEKQLDVVSLNHCYHSVTMTAELVDFFESREHGVETILSLLKQIIGADRLWVFCGRDGLLDDNQLSPKHFQLIASANWLATAMFIADSLPTALMIDIGSTTTDIVAIENHQVSSSAMSDYDRLLTDELVYTGIVRTPVMAINDHCYFDGNRVPLMAEYFATMADVYRLCNELPDHADQSETADGGPKSFVASARRLARMIGRDQHSAPMKQWVALAKLLRCRQLETISCATHRVLSTMVEVEIPVIGAGIGRFLVRDVALQCGLKYRDFTELTAQMTTTLSVSGTAEYAPAVAVACLLRKRLLQSA